MANAYHLLCFDCGCYLSLGKVYWVTSQGSPLEKATFDGVYDNEQRSWRKRDTYFGEVLEAFLLQHRNHEIRFVPEGVDELLETRERPVEKVFPQDLLARQIGIRADGEAELNEWAERLQRRRP